MFGFGVKAATKFSHVSGFVFPTLNALDLKIISVQKATVNAGLLLRGSCSPTLKVRGVEVVFCLFQLLFLCRFFII